MDIDFISGTSVITTLSSPRLKPRAAPQAAESIAWLPVKNLRFWVLGVGTVPGQTGSSLKSGGVEDEEGSEDCERDLHFLLSRQTRLESLRLVGDC